MRADLTYGLAIMDAETGNSPITSATAKHADYENRWESAHNALDWQENLWARISHKVEDAFKG